MRHAKSRLTIHQLVDGQNGKDGLTPQPNLLRDAHLPQHLGAWYKNANNGGAILYEANMAAPVTGAQVWSTEAQARVDCIAELYQNLSVIAGKTYTFSVYAKGAGNGWLIAWPIGPHYELYRATPLEETNGWRRYAVTFVADKSGSTNVYLRAWYQASQRMSGKVYFAAPKLEEGRVATPWLRAQADFKGDDGVGVSAVVTEYAVSSSENSAPSYGWSTTLPTWQQGQYLWTRSRVTFTDGRITTTNPQVDSAWKKLSELAYEQAHMAYLKQVFEQRAGIEGGLLFGSMLQMRDAPQKGASVGDVAAYFNGLRATKVGNTPRPALALGVNNFGKADEKEAIALNFDGSGHIGDLEFNGTGSLVTRGDDAQVLTEFTRRQRCNISELIRKSQRKVSISSETIEVRGDGLEIGRRTFTISSNYGHGEVSISVMCSGDFRDGEDERGNPYEYGAFARTIQTKVVLQKRQSNGVFTDFLFAYTYSSRELRDRGNGVCRLENLPAGTYRWSVELISKIFRNPDTSVYISSSTYTEGLIKPFNAIAGDGIMSFFSAEQYTFVKDGKLHIKGKHDMPGLLASGKVDADGTPSSLWGLATKVYRRSTGEYLILHSIGHTDYSIIITPIGNGNLLVGQLAMQTIDTAWCFIRDVQRNCNLTNTPFTFAIIGRN